MAKEHLIQPPEPMKLAIDYGTSAWMCDGGYPVGHIDDSNPKLCYVDVRGKDRIPLWRTRDCGESWQQVGWWKRHRFDPEDILSGRELWSDEEIAKNEVALAMQDLERITGQEVTPDAAPGEALNVWRSQIKEEFDRDYGKSE